MNPPEQDSDNLADLISQLWRHGQRRAKRQLAFDTVQAEGQETPHPLADSLQQPGQEQTAPIDRS